MAVSVEKPKRFKVSRRRMTVESIKRHAAGYWTVLVRAELELRLPDGRRIVATRRALPIRAQQIGRRNGR